MSVRRGWTCWAVAVSLLVACMLGTAGLALAEDELVAGGEVAQEVEVTAEDDASSLANADVAAEGEDDGLVAEDAEPHLLAQGASVSAPRVVANSSMESGQVTTWDCVWFGSYPQTEIAPSDAIYASLEATSWNSSGDATVRGTRYRRISKSDATDSRYWSSDGYGSAAYRYFRYEPIKWRVLEVSGSTALVMADVGLDCQCYNTETKDVTWETCSLRSWLNGYGAGSNQPGTDYTASNFLETAFSAEERDAVLEATVANDDNPTYGTQGGNDTSYRVFLLSESDAYDAGHGFSADYDVLDEARRCKMSGYARAMGACRVVNPSASYYANCYWWLRSTGFELSSACSVHNDGCVSRYDLVSYRSIAVRPALNLNLSSSSIQPAGTVSSDGTVDETAPTGGEVLDISGASVSAIADQGYTGSAVKPAPTVKLAGTTLKSGTDYTVSYKANTKVGTATVTVTGRGNYTGTKSVTFKIVNWSGASRIPVKATARYTLLKGGYMRVMVNGRRAASDAYVSISGATITGKKAGKTTLYLFDANGKQVARKTVEVFAVHGKTYEFQSSVDAKYVLDIQGKSKYNGAQMIVYKRNGGANQRYELFLKSDGTYVIRSVNSKKYLTVEAATNKYVQQWAWKGGSNTDQRWKLTVDSANRVTFVNVKTSKCFDVQGGKTTNSAKMIVWQSNGGLNQKWKLNQK